ncbi:hypothetical protein EVAR_56006_1 [Eumeta japonica]|uniref:Uncharacterized protein n=1 Tax=Eumeta variegata TaxID=151549 RepID=A0A4C1Z0J8_EUMVA|nr:hypothetical protein EVAR_56006_1 [Eumeta japonica]
MRQGALRSGGNDSRWWARFPPIGRRRRWAARARTRGPVLLLYLSFIDRMASKGIRVTRRGPALALPRSSPDSVS